MMRNPQLPFLPGYNFNRKVGQTRFHKSHFFDTVHDLGMHVDKDLPGIGGAPFSNTVHARWPSLYCRGDVSSLPAWVAFDKETLVFDAYFQEALQEVDGSPFLPRFVKIYFYLEDGTISVQEPRKDNSGIHQGVFIGRQRIRFPPDARCETFVDIIDLNVGKEVELYGRVFKIVNCDRFTRNFLNRLGISVPDPCAIPEDPYLQRRQKIKDGSKPKKPKKMIGDETQFLKWDRHVLRFYGYWDTRDEPDGILHKVVVLYYLADDTIELRDIIPPNAGRAGSVICQRMKVPKEFKGIKTPGSYDNFTVLNVLGRNPRTFRYVLDALNCGAQPTEFYKHNDLAIGALLNIFGRAVRLCDCDDYTKEFYRKNYGIEDFTPHPYPDDDTIVHETSGKPRLPPYNGFGSYEDSANNCRTINPVAVIKDLNQFLRKDKEGMDSRVLRFDAKMINDKPHLCERPFVISYFLSDDTLSVFENVRINSGFRGGMFFGRDKFVKPGENQFGSVPPACYNKDDMYVGSVLQLREFKFLLTDADEYALRYMELHATEFPKSNARLIMHKVREMVRPKYKQFVAEKLGITALEAGHVSYSVLRKALKELLGNDITEHEIITLARKFRIDSPPHPDCERVRTLVHCELKRYIYNTHERLHESFKHYDVMHSGKLTRKQIYTCLRGAKLPLDVELTNALLDCMPRQEDGLIYYQDVLNFLDYERYPTLPVAPVPLKRDLCWMSHAPKVDAGVVNVNAFLAELDLESDFFAGCGTAPDAGGQVIPTEVVGNQLSSIEDPAENAGSCALVLAQGGGPRRPSGAGSLAKPTPRITNQNY